MCAEASRAFLDGLFADSIARIDDLAAKQLNRGGGCMPGPDGGCATFGTSRSLIYAIFGITCLLLLLLSAGVPGMPEIPTIEAVCPIVCFPGLFGPHGSSFLRHWIKRSRAEESGREGDQGGRVPDQGAPSPRAPVEPLLSRHLPSGDETILFEKFEKVPDALRRFDDLLSPEEANAALPPGGSEDVDPFSDFSLRESPGDGISRGPDELPELPPDDLSAPHSGFLTDDEFMQMFEFDDGDVKPTPGIVEFDLCLPENEPAVVACIPAPAYDAAVDEERPLESLIDDLGSDDAGVRGRAVNAVAERGADAVAPLIRALGRADDGRRWCIAEALALIGTDSIPPLIAALGDDATQIGAAATLVRIGGSAVPPLIAALAGDDGEVQFGALYALREIGDAAIQSLVEALDAPEGSIRRSAASVLRELGWKAPDDAGAIRYLIAGEAWLDVADYGEAAVAPLIRILKSPDKEVWWNAARTLGEVGEPAVGPLVDLLHEADDEVRPMAAMALAEIGLPAVDPLIRLLGRKNLRGTAAAALVKIGEPAAEACIRALDSTDGEAREALREILGALGEAAVPSLIQALTSGRSRIRGQVAAILVETGWEPWSDAERAWYLIAREEWMELALMGAPAVVPLIRTLNGDDDRIRGEAAATLGEIGDPAAVRPLVDALADDAVAPVAADALVAIGKPAVAPVLGLLEGEAGAARENAVEVLGRLEAPEAVPAVIELVRSGGDRLHRKAVDALVGIGAPAIGSLIPLLGEDGDGHAGAAAALTGIGDPALPPLVEALGDENFLTRMGAATVLERLGWAPTGVEEQAVYLIALQRWSEIVDLGAPAADLLVARLGDPDTGVQAGAAESLACLGAPAVPPLIRLLGRKNLRGPAEETLVRIGEAAVEPLIQALDKTRLRKTAAGVLVRIGRPAAGPLVPGLGRPDIGQTAAEILGAMGESSLDALVEALGNDDPRIRQRAGEVLIGIGDAAVGPLIGVLGHQNDVVRLEAIDTLTRAGRPAVADLTEALSDERYLVRLGAAEVLGRAGWVPGTESETVCYLIAKEQWASVAEIGAGAVEPLIRTLNDPDSAIQIGAARALGMIGAPAVSRLIHELRTEQDGGQRKAIEALKMIGEPAVVPLIDALQDRDWHIRLGAARALVGIGDPAVEPLVLALRAAAPAIRMGAAATLGKIGNPAAIEPLTAALLQEDWRQGRVVVRALGMMGEVAVKPLLCVLREGNDTARKGAVTALVLIGEQACRLLLGALTDGHFRVRAGAADALDRLGWSPEAGAETVHYLIAKERWGDLVRVGPPAVEPLVAVLNDRDDSIRRRAAKVLGEIGDPRTVPALMPLLHDDYYSVRREAAAALVSIGTPATGPVASALGDPDGDVRKRAADVLAEIGDARVIEALEGISDDEDWYARRAAENAVERIRERAGEGSGDL
ncbi:PBS lyase [Methanoculleus sp. CWC-02]|uniref:PBS lyase n=2 Tax=Methanoculleus oceani TaxID=2184756 RepID=A0ABD4TCT1_9EURY|nr:PBS lyase [Methanoculleus sp. CWC-02]